MSTAASILSRPPRAHRPHRLGAALALAILLAGCGGGGGGSGTSGGPAPGDPSPPRALVDLRVPAAALVKLRSSGQVWAALLEKPHPFMDVVVMERSLRAAHADGTALYTWTPPAGWTLVDFALHPDGQATVVLSNEASLRLLRLDGAGRTLHSLDLRDPQVAQDRYYGDANSVRDRAAMAPWKTRDAARLAAIGDGVGLVIRAGSNNVVAYRFELEGGALRQRWRTLVEPGVHLDAQHPTSGSFDPFEGLENHWQVFMDADAGGRMAVGVLASGRSGVAAGHGAWFGEAAPAGFTDGVLLTVLEANGQRQRTVFVDNRSKSELHAIAWSGDSVLLGGRVRSSRPDDAAGWDGWVAQVEPATGRVPVQRLLDIDRGDAVLGLLPLADGAVLVAGTTGYTQNPNGESVSETSAPLLARLQLATGALSRITVPAGPRGNQVRALARLGANWLVGSSENLPGTHSADADPRLVTADSVVRERVPSN
ncbi:hypothetical protein LE190_13850 [Massilia oculi]|uniref:Uncharacterized protein n=1 Tax=Massilia hydrophila TaxID=3044279 RepID=A0ABS7YF89_9BURK|nr:hypothetical protein [Massilia oculi]MCA1857000.1 hypothetical protein [Massilia oculi]